jgi:phenylacetate-coenzyme A ligase PaaK-like adenylate-forming protein
MQNVLRTFGCLTHLWRARAWPAGRIQSSQLELLRKQIHQATARVPYYRDTLKALEFDSASLLSLRDLCSYPVLTKENVKAFFPDRMVADDLSWKALYGVSTSGTYDRVMVFQKEKKTGPNPTGPPFCAPV